MVHTRGNEVGDHRNELIRTHVVSGASYVARVKTGSRLKLGPKREGDIFVENGTLQRGSGRNHSATLELVSVIAV